MLARCDRSQCKNIPKLAWREVTRVDGDQGRLGAVPVNITNVDGAQEDGNRSKIRSTVLNSRRSDGIEIQDSRRAQGANQPRVGGVLDEIVSGRSRTYGCGLDCGYRTAAVASLILNVDSIVTIRLLPWCMSQQAWRGQCIPASFRGLCLG
jgi:hypothetical protein